MRVLGPGDPLGHRPRRVLVAGLSGSGKSTLAARIGAALDLPYIELDSLHHGPEWVPRREFLDDVRGLAAGDAWVTEFQYDTARPILQVRADLLVHLDPPFPVVLSRLVRRTIRRRIRREELWNGNTEPPFHTFVTDRDHVVRYMIRTRDKYRHLIPEAVAANPALVVVTLRSRGETDAWLARLPPPDAGARPGAAADS